MVRPYHERDAWAQERAELPEQIAALHRDLDATPIEHTPRRDRLAPAARKNQSNRALGFLPLRRLRSP